MPTCRRAWRKVAARALPLQHRAVQCRPRSTPQQPKRRPAEFSPFRERPMETANARYGTGKSSRLRSRFMVRMRLQPRISMSRNKTAKKHELQNDRRSTSPTTSARSLCLDSAQGQALRTPFDHRSASLTPPSRGFFCRRCTRRHVGGRSSRHLLMLVRCMRLIQGPGKPDRHCSSQSLWSSSHSAIPSRTCFGGSCARPAQRSLGEFEAALER